MMMMLKVNIRYLVNNFLDTSFFFYFEELALFFSNNTYGRGLEEPEPIGLHESMASIYYFGWRSDRVERYLRQIDISIFSRMAAYRYLERSHQQFTAYLHLDGEDNDKTTKIGWCLLVATTTFLIYKATIKLWIAKRVSFRGMCLYE